jgi:hypothetical protein
MLTRALVRHDMVLLSPRWCPPRGPRVPWRRRRALVSYVPTVFHAVHDARRAPGPLRSMRGSREGRHERGGACRSGKVDGQQRRGRWTTRTPCADHGRRSAAAQRNGPGPRVRMPPAARLPRVLRRGALPPRSLAHLLPVWAGQGPHSRREMLPVRKGESDGRAWLCPVQ